MNLDEYRRKAIRGELRKEQTAAPYGLKQDKKALNSPKKAKKGYYRIYLPDTFIQLAKELNSSPEALIGYSEIDIKLKLKGKKEGGDNLCTIP